MNRPSVQEVFAAHSCLLGFAHECEGACHLKNLDWLRKYMEGLNRENEQLRSANVELQRLATDAIPEAIEVATTAAMRAIETKGRPVAWMHTLNMELDQKSVRLSLSPDPMGSWGKPGKNYSAEYPVTSEPLYLSVSPMRSARSDPVVTPAEADELIRWHTLCASLSAQSDDFAGARWHREKLSEWQAWRGGKRATQETPAQVVIPLATLWHHLDACFEELGYKEVFLNRSDWELVKANLRASQETTPARLIDFLRAVSTQQATGAQDANAWAAQDWLTAIERAAVVTRPTPRGKPCTCDNCLGSSCACRVDAGEKLGELWYCRKRAESAAPSSPNDAFRWVCPKCSTVIAILDPACYICRTPRPAQSRPPGIPLDDDTRWILGQPNFACHHTAESLRRMGHEIPRKAEAEQAAVLHWMLCLYQNHGAKWREIAVQLINETRPAEISHEGPGG